MLISESKLFQCGETQYTINKHNGSEICHLTRTRPSDYRCDSEGDPLYDSEFKTIAVSKINWDNNDLLLRQIQNAFGIYV